MAEAVARRPHLSVNRYAASALVVIGPAVTAPEFSCFFRERTGRAKLPTPAILQVALNDNLHFERHPPESGYRVLDNVPRDRLASQSQSSNVAVRESQVSTVVLQALPSL